MDQSLDPQLVTLAKAIRQTESAGNFQAQGKSGEYGGYQFMPTTWEATAPKFGVNVPLQQATPQQQNEVAYKQLAEWKQEHPDWNIGNFASAWNAGPGKPNAYLEGNVGTNSQGVSYDTPTYAKNVATAYQQFKSQAQTYPDPTAPLTTMGTTPESPSVGGFLKNAVQSGANLIGGIGEAVLHPIQTVQNVGGAAVGGLQELGGQTNENTAKFDNLASYFKNRYGGVDNVLHTAYTDPIGLAADISTVLGGAGAVVGAAGKVADVGEASRLAAAGRAGVDFVAGPDGIVRSTAGVSNPIVDAAKTTGSVLNRASELTNPLTPVIAGAGKLLGRGADAVSGVAGGLTGVPGKMLQDIYRNPADYTPQDIANITRSTVSHEVESALKDKIESLDETGSGYNPIREAATQIKVADNFLENQLRTEAGVDVVDGRIVAKGSSSIRDAKDVAAVQQLFNTWKPEFQKGTLTSEEFLNFRQDLSKVAKFDREFSASKPVEGVAAKIRQNLNTEYRKQVSGLDKLDEDFAAQKTSLDELRKGFIDKDGNLLESATNKIANSLGKGKDAQLARLEEIIPGITRRIEVMRTIEAIRKASETNGGFLGKLVEGGSFVTGISTANIPLIAGAISTAIVASPQVAIPLLRVFAGNKALISTVVAQLSKYAISGETLNAAINNPIQPEQGNTPQPQESDQKTGNKTSPESALPLETNAPQNIEALASQHGFDLMGAHSEGHSDAEIESYLQSLNHP